MFCLQKPALVSVCFHILSCAECLGSVLVSLGRSVELPSAQSVTNTIVVTVNQSQACSKVGAEKLVVTRLSSGGNYRIWSCPGSDAVSTVPVQ